MFLLSVETEQYLRLQDQAVDEMETSKTAPLVLIDIEQRAPDPSMGPELTGGRVENDGPLPSFEEVLRGTGEPQEPQPAVSSLEHESGRANSAAEHPTPIDCDNAPTPATTRGGNRRGETDGHNNSHLGSDGSTSEEQGGGQGSPNTPTISVTVLAAGYDLYHLHSLISLLTEACNLGFPPPREDKSSRLRTSSSYSSTRWYRPFVDIRDTARVKQRRPQKCRTRSLK